MDNDHLTAQEKETLLKIARQALELVLRGKELPPLNQTELTSLLKAEGASFVTLTKRGQLRGCIGTLEPSLPLAEDVREHAIAAALNDYRFSNVRAEELDEIKIEISRLTVPTLLDYDGPDDLLAKIRPGVDGIVLRDAPRRATFLPQVWKQVPDKVDFLGQLCQKMGASRDLWQRKKLEVLIYQVEEFHE